MPGSYFPDKLADQVLWAQNFDARCAADAGGLGLSESLLESLKSANAALQAAYVKAEEPTTRTKVAVQERRDALKELRRVSRLCVSIIRGTPGVTDAQLEALGLTIPSGTRRTVPPPSEAPIVRVVGTSGRRVEIQIRREGALRGKAPHAVTTALFTHRGETAPTTQGQWQFAMNTGSTIETLAFPGGETTETFWITAFFMNAKGQSGPASQPQKVMLLPGGFLPSEQRAGSDASPMKIAA